MNFFCFILISIFLLFQSLSLPSISLAKNISALAALSQIKGEVKAGPFKKLINGFNGQMLWRKYKVQTGENSSTTLIFKDGSELRLFANSNLKIGLKKSYSPRWSRYRILLISGSFWGYFVRDKNPVEIVGESLSLFSSISSFRFTRRKVGHNISVSSGIVKVSNPVSSVKLISGQRLYKVQKKDFLPQKISPIPNKLKLWIEPKNPNFLSEKTIMINLFLQVVRSGTETKISRPGPVYLRTNYYNLTIPNSIKLNTEGKAKINLEVKPPHSNDRTFDGSIVFKPLMDQNNYDDVQDGSLKVKFGLTLFN